jgi:hypothetical protein
MRDQKNMDASVLETIEMTPPCALMDADRSDRLSSECEKFKDRKGVYIWLVKTSYGWRPIHVGQSAVDIRRRLLDHRRHAISISGPDRVYDGAGLLNGKAHWDCCIWWNKEKHGPKKEEESCAAMDYLQRVKVSIVDCGTRTPKFIKRLEGGVARTIATELRELREHSSPRPLDWGLLDDLQNTDSNRCLKPLYPSGLRVEISMPTDVKGWHFLRNPIWLGL